jgi:GMP synthase-like glutamine amidotransferase
VKRALIFQHMDHDTPGRFSDFLAEDGFVPKSIRLWEGQAIPALKDYDFLFVLGGAQDVWEEDKYPWLVAEKEAIREWVATRAKPYIGICLGHQLLASALGGTVSKAERGEVGVHDIQIGEGAMHPFFAGLHGVHKVMQWHLAEVSVPPKGAHVLASSESTEVQAIAIDGHAIGLQFHAEFTPQTVSSWESLPSYVAALEKNLGRGAYDRVLAESYPLLPRMGVMARRIYDNLMSSAGLKRAA